MNIELQCNTNKIKIAEHIVRNINGYCHEEQKNKEIPHFQALVIDDRKLPTDLITSIHYYDSNNQFLGLDEGSTWCSNSNSTRSISIPITIPKNTVRAKISIAAVKSKKLALQEIILILLFCALTLFSGMLVFGIKW